MPLMGAIEKRPHVVGLAVVPAEIAVVAGDICQADELVAKALCRCRDLSFGLAAICECRRASGILHFREAIERPDEGGCLAGTMVLRGPQVDLVADGPERDRGMIVVLPDQLGELLARVGAQRGIGRR